MIYLDTSVIVKLIRPEAESGDLVEWLSARQGESTLTSKLTEVERGSVAIRWWPRAPWREPNRP